VLGCPFDEGGGTMRTQSEDVVRAYFTAVNEGRLEELVALFAPEASLHFPLSDPIVGREAIGRFYETILQFYPERCDDVRRLFFSPEGDVAAEIHFTGTTRTGRRVVFEAVDLFTLREGQIEKLQIFYDSARVREMIGTPPEM
jgi:ketosteroid isomerase-like protein